MWHLHTYQNQRTPFLQLLTSPKSSAYQLTDQFYRSSAQRNFRNHWRHHLELYPLETTPQTVDTAATWWCQRLGHLIPIKLVCFSSIYRHSFPFFEKQNKYIPRFTFSWKLGRKEFREKSRHVWFFPRHCTGIPTRHDESILLFLFFNTIHFWKIQDLAARFGKFQILQLTRVNSPPLTHHY